MEEKYEEYFYPVVEEIVTQEDKTKIKILDASNIEQEFWVENNQILVSGVNQVAVKCNKFNSLLYENLIFYILDGLKTYALNPAKIITLRV